MIRTGDVIENPVTGERLHFLATSADTRGEKVVANSLHGDVFVWDARTGAALHTLKWEEEGWRDASGFSPDGRLLAFRAFRWGWADPAPSMAAASPSFLRIPNE